MQRALMFRVLGIALLGMLLLVPLAMIQGQIRDRAGYRNLARHDIAQSWTADQTIVGPILVVPYTVRTIERTWHGGKAAEVERIQHRTLMVVPRSLDVRSTVETQRRRRGIFSVPVYSSEHRIGGTFELAAVGELARSDGFERFGEAFVALHVTDSRGIAAAPELSWGDESPTFMTGSGLPGLASGVRAGVTLGDRQRGGIDFELSLQLRGMGQLAFAPVGRSTAVAVASPWPHPSFSGSFLPQRQAVSEGGFEARWTLSQFATDIDRHLEVCMTGSCGALASNSFGVAFVDPVDVYLKTERSTKYGILFIALTFVAFFLVELLKAHRIHPMQYLLVGLALSIFFLLLLSLSEHVAFGWAYLGAASACIALLAYYCRFVLGSRSAGALLGGALTVLYAALYVIVRSEDAALLMGSGLLFLTLASVIVLTRRVDWYASSAERIGRAGAAPDGPA